MCKISVFRAFCTAQQPIWHNISHFGALTIDDEMAAAAAGSKTIERFAMAHIGRERTIRPSDRLSHIQFLLLYFFWYFHRSLLLSWPSVPHMCYLYNGLHTISACKTVFIREWNDQLDDNAFAINRKRWSENNIHRAEQSIELERNTILMWRV